MSKNKKKPTIAEARLKVVKAIEALKKAERNFINNFCKKDVKVPYYDGLWLYCKSISSDKLNYSFTMTFKTMEGFPVTFTFDNNLIDDLLFEVEDIRDRIEEQEQTDDWYRDHVNKDVVYEIELGEKDDDTNNKTDVENEMIEGQSKPKPKKKAAAKKKGSKKK